jgi:hypothetical protein
MSEKPRSVPVGKPAGGSADGKPERARRPERLAATIFILVCLLLPTLGGLVGYRVAHWQTDQKGNWDSPDKVRKLIQFVHERETMAGTFKSEGVSLDGVEKCYYPDPIDFTQVVWSSLDMPAPFLTFAPRPGPIPGGYINGQQFRYDRNLESPKPAGTCRIFLVGGSTAFGTGARCNDRTVAGYLERYLNEQARRHGCRFEVVTAANPGWHSSHERILIENRLLELEPDLVIALSGNNDVFWGTRMRDINYHRGAQELYFVMLANAVLQKELGEGFPLEVPGEKQSVSAAQTAARMRRNAELSHAALQRVGADYCLALQPILGASRKVRTPREERVLQRVSGGYTNAKQQDADFIERYDECRSQLSGVKLPHFHFWDLTGVFDAQNDSDIFIDRCHFGDRGNDLMAKRMLDLLAPILTARFKQ